MLTNFYLNLGYFRFEEGNSSETLGVFSYGDQRKRTPKGIDGIEETNWTQKHEGLLISLYRVVSIS